MQNSRDLILGEVVYIFIIYHILFHDFIYQMVTIFRFYHMIGENQQRHHSRHWTNWHAGEVHAGEYH